MSPQASDLDSVLDLCRNQERRVVLAVLTDVRRPMTLTELTEAALEYTHRAPNADRAADEGSVLRVSLYHRHLPKLAAAGLVEFDPEQRLVEPTTKLEELQPPLSSLLDADPVCTMPTEQ